MFSYFLKLSALVLAIGLSAFVNAQTKSFYAAHHDYNVVTVAEGFAQPWSMAWLPDGDMLVTEKPGRLRIVRDGQLLPEAVAGVPEVFYTGQGGLFEVLPHPDFENNRWIYLSFARVEGETSVTAVVRARFENDRLSNCLLYTSPSPRD